MKDYDQIYGANFTFLNVLRRLKQILHITD